METKTGAGTETSGYGNEDEDGDRSKNEDGIREGGREAKKRKKPHKSCRRHVGSGENLGRERTKRKKKRWPSSCQPR